MHIKDHSAAMKFFRTYDSAASKGKWKEFVNEMEFDSMLHVPRTTAADGGRIGLQGGTNVRTRQGFQPKNPGNIQSLKKKNIEAGKTRSAKLERAKVLLKEGKSKAQATKIIVGEFKLTRHPYAGTAPWMKDAANELITEGYEIIPGKQDTGGKKRAATKRQRAIGKGPGPEGDPTRFEWRMKKVKTKSGIGKIYETAHTANIFQAKKLGIDYPIDALQLQKKGINQEVAEILDGELKPLYKKQYDLVSKLKKNPTPALRKSLDQINYQIAELVSSGGTQGEKAVNVLRAIQVDPYTLKGRVAELGYDFSKAIDTGMTGATTKTAQLGTEADVIAKANYKQLLKDQGGFKKTFNKNLIKLGCGMYAGGRVGFKVGSGKCINRAIAKLKSGNLSATEKKIVDAMGDGLKKGGMPKKFWTTALKGEGYFALADFANNLTKGQSLDKSFSNAIEMATFTLVDLGGIERDLMKYAEERGLDTEAIEEWMDYAQTYGKYAKAHEDQQYAHETLVSDEISIPEDLDLQQSVLDQSPDRIKKLEDKFKEQEKAEGIQSGKGYKDLNEMIEGVVAKEWNKPAGTVLDRGLRKMLGMKGDEGMVWGPIGALTREGIESLGFGEHDALKGFTPQPVMNYHPAYGYKEDIKDVIREGDSPMEDMLMFMEKNFPSTALRDEALRTKEEDAEFKEQWVDTGFGRKKRKVKKDMGSYDYDPKLDAAEGGIASLNVKK